MTSLPSSFYWYDYETFGISPAYDRPAQFAGQRTDMDLQPVGEPLVVYNRLTDDYLPDPDACKITGISPDTVNQKGLCERDFIDAIVAELGEPGTCNVGYNNIRFDDEFTRYTLFRNFHDPYSHEWRNQNSRWDVLDFVRLTRALRPEGIEWPVDDEGLATNRLEHLTKANGLSHEHAHDALSDVEATIAMVRLIKDRQPRLFDYAVRHHNKQACAKLLDLRSKQLLVHASGMIPRQQHHLAIVVPVTQHPFNRNEIITFDLSHDPDELIALASKAGDGATEISTRVFTKAADLPEGVQRLPLKTIRLNKAPALAPVNVVRPSDCERLDLDLEMCERNAKKLLAMSDAQQQEIQQAFNPSSKSGSTIVPDVDSSLYSGDFAGQHDATLFEKIRRSDARSLAEYSEKPVFEDARYDELLIRYRARNFPGSLNAAEEKQWINHCKSAIGTGNSFETFRQKLEHEDWSQPELRVLKDSLLAHADTVYMRLHGS